MAQIKPEHAGKRLGFRAPKAVAAAGIAAVASLGTIGALNLRAPGLEIVPAATTEYTQGTNPVPPNADSPSGEPLLLPQVVVHVDGSVLQPGVYTLSGETVRVCDAVEAAGGLADDADTSTVNLAQPIVDGSKVHIPSSEEVSAAQAGADSPGASLVNLNTAGMEELVQLPGVGEQTARAILQSREQYGPFASVDDLLRVSGIGEKKLEKIKPYACV